MWLTWLGGQLYALFTKHRDQVVVAVANVVRMAVAHLAGLFSHSIPGLEKLSLWLVDPLAFGIVALIGVIWGAWLKSRSNQVAIAATRIAVAEATNQNISAVPDSVHEEALAVVREKNKNGGVPPPPKP